jgi:hypothetical protein
MAGEMTWMMGAFCLLAAVVLVLVGAAAVKYLFFR